MAKGNSYPSSNKAQLLVNKATGKLLLQQVPNFNFGKLPASYIYEGTKIESPLRKTILKLWTVEQRGGDFLQR